MSGSGKQLRTTQWSPYGVGRRILRSMAIGGIDAFEKHQAFGERSTQHLAALVFRKQVTVEWHKTDRYRRIVGKVVVGDQDAGLEQIRAGLAWHYKAHEEEQSAPDQIAYARAELQARQEGRGLWSDDSPVAPWVFRHIKASGQKLGGAK